VRTGHPRGGDAAGSWTGLLVGYDFEMSANAFIDLLDRRLSGGHVTERVQQQEIVVRAVVTNRVDVNISLFQLAEVLGPGQVQPRW